jgi:hypothetical protein
MKGKIENRGQHVYMCKYSTLMNATAILKQSDESRRLTGTINILPAASEIVGALKIESKVCSSIDWMIQRYNSTNGCAALCQNRYVYQERS